MRALSISPYFLGKLVLTMGSTIMHSKSNGNRIKNSENFKMCSYSQIKYKQSPFF